MKYRPDPEAPPKIGFQIGCQIRFQIGLQQGFTLIELLVALTIIAILAATATPVYLESVRKARRAEARSAVMEIMQRQERYFSQHGTYVAFDRQQANAYRWHLGERAKNSAYEFSGAACQGANIAECIIVTASPGTAAVDHSYQDPQCGELSLASNGVKSSAGLNCW
jgi:type IV pilus assembly protein PilE